MMALLLPTQGPREKTKPSSRLAADQRHQGYLSSDSRWSLWCSYKLSELIHIAPSQGRWAVSEDVQHHGPSTVFDLHRQVTDQAHQADPFG
jgi:hypothetical protein